MRRVFTFPAPACSPLHRLEMDDILDAPDFDLAGSRSSSAVLPSAPIDQVGPPLPSELRLFLAEHIFDVSGAYLDSLEAHLNSLGVGNVRHLASLHRARQHDDQIARALWSEVLSVFGEKPSLQQWQFTNAAQEADNPARTRPPLLPPAAPVNTSPSSPVLTRTALAQRLCRALHGAATWHVPDSIWNAFFSSRTPVPVLNTAVALDTTPARPRISCVMCSANFAVHYKNNSWSLSTLLEHLKEKHASAAAGPAAAVQCPPDSNKRGHSSVMQNDQYWSKFRRTSPAEPTGAATLPSPLVPPNSVTAAPPLPLAVESHQPAASTCTVPAAGSVISAAAGEASSGAAPIAPDPEWRS